MTGPKTNERPGTRAQVKFSRMSAYKAREVLDLIRGEDVTRAQEILRFCERDAAIVVGKLLASAVANAEHDHALVGDELFVSACFADEGPTLKRWRPRARGRATRIRKRTSHMTIVVARFSDEQLQARRRKEAAAPGGRRRVLPRRRRGEEKDKGKAAAPAAEKVEAVSEEPPEEASVSEAEPGAPEETEIEAAAVESEVEADDPGERGVPDDPGERGVPDDPGERGVPDDKAARYATLGREEEAPAAEATEEASEDEEEGSS
jgi:large subunit ribosomal protein L22